MGIKSFDVLGNISVVNFPRDFKKKDKKKFAEKILKENSSIKTVLEKTGKVKGRLRKPSIKYLAGEKTKEVLYKENNCVFRFNTDKTYFSPRLSNERKEIASKIKKGEKVLVMFAGVAPFSIVIAKNSKAEKVFSNEINREANKYSRLNADLNKVKNKIVFVDGDIKRVVKKWSSVPPSISPTTRPNSTAHLHSQFSLTDLRNFSKFDVIIMPRPQLKETFLEQAFYLSKKKTRIYYYDFCKIGDENLIVDKIKKEAQKFKKKIKILKIKKAGEIAPYKIRVRVDFVVL